MMSILFSHIPHIRTATKVDKMRSLMQSLTLQQFQRMTRKIKALNRAMVVNKSKRYLTRWLRNELEMKWYM